MKILRQIAAITLVTSLSVGGVGQVKQAEANPAAIAPAAFCAGTAGVGCVIIGTAVVGGVVYYIWQRSSDGKKVRADVNGQVFRSQKQPKRGPTIALSAKNKASAIKECIEALGTSKIKVFSNGKDWYCYEVK